MPRKIRHCLPQRVQFLKHMWMLLVLQQLWESNYASAAVHTCIGTAWLWPLHWKGSQPFGTLTLLSGGQDRRNWITAWCFCGSDAFSSLWTKASLEQMRVPKVQTVAHVGYTDYVLVAKQSRNTIHSLLFCKLQKFSFCLLLVWLPGKFHDVIPWAQSLPPHPIASHSPTHNGSLKCDQLLIKTEMFLIVPIIPLNSM